MRSLHIICTAAALLLMSAACGSTQPPASSVPIGAPTAASAPGSEEIIDFEKQLEDFDPSKFDRSTAIDNVWFPLQPGTRLVYEGFTAEDNEQIPHRVVFTVTDLTKVIDGVRTVVVWDQDYSAGQLEETELVFFAQDNDGTVWHLGQYPEVYEDGALVEAPAWIHGIEGARAGILMKAQPQLGTPSYSQGWGPAVNWTDRARLAQVGQEACVPFDCYKDVLVTEEFSREEPNAFQLKYYARGVGNIRVGWSGADVSQEVLELVDLVRLDSGALAEARAEALELERRAYDTSKEVYALTPPVELPAGASGLPAPAAPAAEVVVYASDLRESALSEFDVWDDPTSPGGKLVGTPNTGGHLDPPPEDDPHVTFTASVQAGVPYRCWVHMKVGAPKGESQANLLWVQFSDAVDETNTEILKPGTASYLTAQGPAQEGWAWVGCGSTDPASPAPLVSFRTSGEITVRLQAGMEGVGFDQFLLSSARFLEQPPAEPVVAK